MHLLKSILPTVVTPNKIYNKDKQNEFHKIEQPISSRELRPGHKKTTIARKPKPYSQTVTQADNEPSVFTDNVKYSVDYLIEKSQIVHKALCLPDSASCMQPWIHVGIKSCEAISTADMIAGTKKYSYMQGLFEIQCTMHVRVSYPTHLPWMANLHVKPMEQLLQTHTTTMDISVSFSWFV